jgi:hypothetical protein
MRYRWIVPALLLVVLAALPLVLTAEEPNQPAPVSTAGVAGAPNLASGCLEYLVNGGFEGSTGWYLPITEYSAGYSTAQANSGTRSLRMGIVNALDNRYAYSDANQQVTLPADATSITLYYSLYPISGEAGPVPTPYPRMMGDPRLMDWLPYDVQYLLILDKYDHWIDTVMWQCRNDQTWLGYVADLTAYRGQTIKLHFGAYNQGTGSVTAMYLDNASLAVCQPPTSTPTPVTPTLTPTPSPTMAPMVCPEALTNGGFETSAAWYLPITEYTAGYAGWPVHSGARSLRMGIAYPGDNRYAYSDANQEVIIPTGATDVTLRFYSYPVSGDAGPVPTPYPRSMTKLSAIWLPYDVQYLLLLDKYDNWIDTLMWECSNAAAWGYHSYDLSGYAGRTIKLHFGAYNQGSGGVTTLYLDDVSLEVCAPAPVMPTSLTLPLILRDHVVFGPGPTSTPTATVSAPTPTPTATSAYPYPAP